MNILNISDLIADIGDKNTEQSNILCAEYGVEEVKNYFFSPVFVDAIVAILVLNGTCTFMANYKTYTVVKNDIILISASHLFHFIDCNDEMRCVSMFVSKNFMDSTDSTDMIYRKIKYGTLLFRQPVLHLTGDGDSEKMYKRLKDIEFAIMDTEHLYYAEVILNHLMAFYLDLSNIIDTHHDFIEKNSFSRYENVVRLFIDLLINNYRVEHKVTFYAKNLSLSEHYLTLVLKRITGQTPCDFIYEMLYSEARTLLTHSKLSVQEISLRLNFSDQSSFGKFFKLRSGLSPMAYRRSKA